MLYVMPGSCITARYVKLSDVGSACWSPCRTEHIMPGHKVIACANAFHDLQQRSPRAERRFRSCTSAKYRTHHSEPAFYIISCSFHLCRDAASQAAHSRTLSSSSSGCTPLQELYQREAKDASTLTSTLCVVMAGVTAAS